jgi:mRNA-degrading endonuclease toxin of MazEF toxin-antitoxin module
MTSFERGDVVLVDLRMVAKVRPCVVVSIPNPDPERNMAVVVPMTTEIACEVGVFPKDKMEAISEIIIKILALRP